MEKQDDESIISHLEALRNMLIKCLVSLAIILPFAFWASPFVLKFLERILIGNHEIKLNYFAPMEVFILQIKLAILVSAVIAFPYIIKQVWDFILPALYENERKFIGVMTILSSLLFAGGITFCLFVILPLIINFALSFSNETTNAMFGISNLMNTALWISFAFGLMFQAPLITHLLIKFDIVSYETISSKRRYVIILLLIAAALLTPPDVISQLFLFIPTYLLFETGLIFSKKTQGENILAQNIEK